MELTCVRCGKTGSPPERKRVPFGKSVKEKVLGSICEVCWKEWEAMEVKVVNEYRLNFLDPKHREMLSKTCLDFLNLAPTPEAE